MRPSGVASDGGAPAVGAAEVRAAPICATTSAASSAGAATWSTRPVAIAARGMPSNMALSGCCANTKPPCALIAPMPREPSDPVPDSTTAIARSWNSSARLVKKMSIGSDRPCAGFGSS
jgi:hypothetical protein